MLATTHQMLARDDNQTPTTMALQGGLLQHQLKSLRGKVVLVTGASSGLGVDLCLDLAKAGCRVVAAARRVDRLISLCDEINGVPNDEELPNANGDQHQQCRAVAVELDVSAKAKAIETAINRAWAAFGTIDALVNNAGIRGGVLMSTDLSEQEWDDVIRTNLKGTWLVSKFFCSLLHGANKSGSIINISSIAGLTRGQWPGATAYAASKAGIINLTQMMSLEMGNRNIRVNCISPGLFKSEVTSSLMEKDWINRVAMKSVPLRTFVVCDPGLTSLVRYLIDDSSQYVSGNNFIVDGGHILSAVPIYSSL